MVHATFVFALKQNPVHSGRQQWERRVSSQNFNDKRKRKKEMTYMYTVLHKSCTT